MSGKDSEMAEQTCSTEVPEFPLIAELEDLVGCLELMGTRPIKLIAKERIGSKALRRYDSPKPRIRES